MRIYLIGPVGVGKSYILDELEKQGYKVYKDPIIDQNLLEKGTPYEIQAVIESSFLQRDIACKDGIFDTSLETTQWYAYIQWLKGLISDREYSKLHALEEIYQDLLNNGKNHYIFIKRDIEEINSQIIKRGRAYEIGNPFYIEMNKFLLEQFDETKEDLDVIELHGSDISPVINRIKELLK